MSRPKGQEGFRTTSLRTIAFTSSDNTWLNCLPWGRLGHPCTTQKKAVLLHFIHSHGCLRVEPGREHRKAWDDQLHFLFTPAQLSSCYRWTQPGVGDCSPQLPVSNCKPVAFGMIQMNGVQVCGHQCQVLLAVVHQCERFIGMARPAGSQSGICHTFLLSEQYRRPQHMPSPGPQHAFSWSFFFFCSWCIDDYTAEEKPNYTKLSCSDILGSELPSDPRAK